MDATARTRDFFLLCMAIIYLFAFGSVYVQIPGLFGKRGILPVSSLLQTVKEENPKASAEGLFMHTPTLLWFMKVDPDIGLELLSIFGVVISFMCIILQNLRTMPCYTILWLLYMSVYKVGETFLWFQWDILLLEVGCISIFVAPLVNKTNDSNTEASIHRQVPFYLVKWLLFRLMFASGVVKLTSQCPTWWKLTALDYHFESQCIPTPLAWRAHNLPAYLHQLSVIATYIIEIGLPVLFFSPLRLPRLVAAYAQVLLMITIFLSGNYNFFNLLTIVLCLPLIDDAHLEWLKYLFSFGFYKPRVESGSDDAESGTGGEVEIDENKLSDRTLCWLKIVMNVAIFSTCGYLINRLFVFETHRCKLAFTYTEFNSYLKWIMPYLVKLGVAYFIAVSGKVLYRSVIEKHKTKEKIQNFVKFLLVFLPSVYLFTISMVRFADVEPGYRANLWPVANKWHRSSMSFDLVHSYGLFRRMTGVGGRPEVILEGSNSADGGWKEYHFVYKPGNVSTPPLWITPHQPRLDWQMWFAALGSYQHNPWIISLMHRILIGQPEVLQLLDQANNPFKNKPPKYIRASLYHYHFTKYKEGKGLPRNWWKREFKNSYVPVISASDTNLVDFLKYNKLLPKPIPKKLPLPGLAELFAGFVRRRIASIYPPLFLWSLLFSAIFVSRLETILAKK